MLVNQSKNHASSLVNKAWEKKQNKKHVKIQKQTGRMRKHEKKNSNFMYHSKHLHAQKIFNS